MSTLDMGPGEEYGLGGDARKLLVASFRAAGIDQGRIYKLIFDQGDVFRAGSVSLEGFAGQIALDELVEKAFVRQESRQVYVLTPSGAQTAAVLAVRESTE